jgi:hypothetical protein
MEMIDQFEEKIHIHPGRTFRSPDPSGFCRKDAGKSPDPAGKYWKSLEYGSSIPIKKRPDFFRHIPVNFLCFPAGTGRKSSEKIRKFPIGILLPKKSLGSPRTDRFRAGLLDLGKWTFIIQ